LDLPCGEVLDKQDHYKLTIELVHTFWDKIFDILGTGDWKTKIPYKNRDSTFDHRFKKIVQLLFELSGRAQFKKISNLLFKLVYKAQDFAEIGDNTSSRLSSSTK
jgi:hypothetical protein